ncbi:MAG: tetratricopeptide repeat protein [Ectothiorhodospiraceae bacterium]|nr:tetratricopeptide repeat protein [Ectothiorhodospiraceae bacterium]
MQAKRSEFPHRPTVPPRASHSGRERTNLRPVVAAVVMVLAIIGVSRLPLERLLEEAGGSLGDDARALLAEGRAAVEALLDSGESSDGPRPAPPPRRSQGAERVAAGDGGAASARSQSPPRWRVLLDQAREASRARDHDAAEALYLNALHAAESGDVGPVVPVLVREHLASFYLRQRRHEEARALYAQVIPAYQALGGDPARMARVERGYGLTLRGLGDTAAALEHLYAAVGHAREGGDGAASTLVFALTDAAGIQNDLGQRSRALSDYGEAVAASRAHFGADHRRTRKLEALLAELGG